MSTRKGQGAYWLYGVHAVVAAMGNPGRRIRRLAFAGGVPEAVAALHDKARHPRPETLESKALSHLLPPEAVHQGVAALVEPLAGISLHEILENGVEKPLLLLDQVTDPHNVGAILRSAAAFGAGAVVLTEHHAPSEGAVMAKAASGALELVSLVYVSNLSQAMAEVKKAGYWVAGLDGEARQAMHEAKLSRNTALVLGAEGKGLRRLTAERCDLLVKLPIDPKMESLNVSNAAAVALYELARAAF